MPRAGRGRKPGGGLGSPRNAKRRYVRMISLARPAAEAICLVTDLLDAAAYPAADLFVVSVALGD